MKLIHLSDLHLGKRVEEISMIEDQEYILRQILGIIQEEKADAVLMSGDIYDKSVPSAEAMMLFDHFLNNLAQMGVQALIISGNHDSPERLAFGNRLMEGAGIHLAPVYDGKVEPIVLSDDQGEVHFWLLPFVKPMHVRRFYESEGIESYTDACRVAVEQMHIDPTVRNVLLTHQFVTGAAVCDSEEISVGGSDNVDASVFADFDYVALGHIHGPQNIVSNKVRYCGTPLKYSFSEERHHKSVTVVNLGAKGELKLDAIPLIPYRDMRTIRGEFAELTSKAYYENTQTKDYLHVVLTDEETVPEAIGKLRTIYPNILKLSYDNTRTRMDQMVDGAKDVEKKTHLQLFGELYEMLNNQPMCAQQVAFAQQLIESIWEDEK